MSSKRWTVKNAAHVTGAGITAVLAIAALGLVGASGNSLDFGGDLEQDLKAEVALPNQTYEVVCLGGLDNEIGKKQEGRVIVSESAGVDITEAIDLETGEPVSGKAGGGATTYTSKDPIALTVQTRANSQLRTITVGSSDNEEVRGLVLDQCEAPRNTSWFAIGSTEVGEATLLTVSNPAKQATEVEISALSGVGGLEQTAAFTVKAKSTRTVNLATYFPENDRLMVRVDASGPGAVSTARTVGMRGLAPQGYDAVTGSVEPQKEFALVGFRNDVAQSKFRLANPSDQIVTAEIMMITEEGTRPLPGGELMQIDPGAVFQLTLDGLGPEVSTLYVKSDYPLIGSISGSIPGEKNQDGETLADRVVWTPGSLFTNYATYVPDYGKSEGAETFLYLTNTHDTPVVAQVNGEAVEIPANSSAKKKVPSGDLEIDATQPIYGSLNAVVKQPSGTMASTLTFTDANDGAPTTALVIDR